MTWQRLLTFAVTWQCGSKWQLLQLGVLLHRRWWKSLSWNVGWWYRRGTETLASAPLHNMWVTRTERHQTMASRPTAQCIASRGKIILLARNTLLQVPGQVAVFGIQVPVPVPSTRLWERYRQSMMERICGIEVKGSSIGEKVENEKDECNLHVQRRCAREDYQISFMNYSQFTPAFAVYLFTDLHFSVTFCKQNMYLLYFTPWAKQISFARFSPKVLSNSKSLQCYLWITLISATHRLNMLLSHVNQMYKLQSCEIRKFHSRACAVVFPLSH